MKPKIYVRNFNGIMDGLIKSDELERVLDPRDSDVIVLWNDVRSELVELSRINKKHLKKPLIVVQHGAGATRDYEHPENFPMLADKFCCWGTHDYDRLIKQGKASQAVLTGCPLTNQLKPKEEHKDKNIIFTPIITSHEEPSNIATYYELKKAEIDYAQKNILKHKEELINAWNPSVFSSEDTLSERTIPYYDINKNFRLISKLTSIHDKSLYMGSVCETTVGSPTHIEGCVKLLTNTDVVVGMVESTFQLLAMAMDIPVVICREWEFKMYAGKDYTDCDHLITNGATYTDLSDLRKVVEEELSNPGRLKNERKEVVARELGDLTQDPDKNIITIIKELTNG